MPILSSFNCAITYKHNSLSGFDNKMNSVEHILYVDGLFSFCRAHAHTPPHCCRSLFFIFYPHRSYNVHAIISDCGWCVLGLKRKASLNREREWSWLICERESESEITSNSTIPKCTFMRTHIYTFFCFSMHFCCILYDYWATNGMHSYQLLLQNVIHANDKTKRANGEKRKTQTNELRKEEMQRVRKQNAQENLMDQMRSHGTVCAKQRIQNARSGLIIGTTYAECMLLSVIRNKTIKSIETNMWNVAISWHQIVLCLFKCMNSKREQRAR